MISANWHAKSECNGEPDKSRRTKVNNFYLIIELLFCEQLSGAPFSMTPKWSSLCNPDALSEALLKISEKLLKDTGDAELESCQRTFGDRES